MVEVPITIACGNYDRTRALMDGRVKVEGCAVTYLPLYPEEIFFRVPLPGIDVCELSFSSHIRTVAAGTWPMQAFLPSCRACSGIPASTCGLILASRSPMTYAASASEFRNIRSPPWSGCAACCSMNTTSRQPRSIGAAAARRSQAVTSTPLKPIPGIDLEPIGRNETLVGLLRDRKLDALFTARAPSSFLRGEPAHPAAVQRHPRRRAAYYKRTRLFPLMHLAGIRRELVEKHPWLPTSVYKAFCEARRSP